MERLVKRIVDSGTLTAESIGEFKVKFELSCYRQIIPSHSQEELLGSSRINGRITHSDPEMTQFVELQLLRGTCSIIDDSGSKYEIVFVPRFPHFSVHSFPEQLNEHLYPDRK